MPGSGSALPEVGWMLPFERRLAAKAYENWSNRLVTRQPTETGLNQKKALNAAYTGAAFCWMTMWVPLIFAAALTYQTSNGAAIILAILAVIPVGMFAWRIFQAVRAYSGYSMWGST